MRNFYLIRHDDDSTGIVAEGVQFATGKCALSYLAEPNGINLYDSIEDVEVDPGHDGKMVILREG